MRQQYYFLENSHYSIHPLTFPEHRSQGKRTTHSEKRQIRTSNVLPMYFPMLFAARKDAWPLSAYCWTELPSAIFCLRNTTLHVLLRKYFFISWDYLRETGALKTGSTCTSIRLHVPSHNNEYQLSWAGSQSSCFRRSPFCWRLPYPQHLRYNPYNKSNAPKKLILAIN